MSAGKWNVAYDNQRRTLTEIRALARRAALEALEDLGLELVYDREGHAQYEIDVAVKIVGH